MAIVPRKMIIYLLLVEYVYVSLHFVSHESSPSPTVYGNIATAHAQITFQ